VDKDIDIWKQRNEILHKKVNRQMDEIKDLNEKSETIFDLARKYPNKTYVELEAYRDADRQEEAQQIPLSESQQKQEELEPIEGEEQDNPELFKTEIDYHRYWKDMYEKEHKLRQEAEGELTILKGIETNRVKEAQEALANALEVNESHQKFNGKLQERLTELEQENIELHANNKKLTLKIEERIDNMRKAGM